MAIFIVSPLSFKVKYCVKASGRSAPASLSEYLKDIYFFTLHWIPTGALCYATNATLDKVVT